MTSKRAHLKRAGGFVMAAYKKVVLPPLRHTSRPTRGPKCVSSVHRGATTINESSHEVFLPATKPSRAEFTPVEPLVGASSMLDPSASSLHEPTEHELHCKSSIAGWENLREAFQVVLTEKEALEEGRLCIVCGELASLHCQRCGTLGFFCSQCFMNFHSEANMFHVAEKWEVRNFTSGQQHRWRS